MQSPHPVHLSQFTKAMNTRFHLPHDGQRGSSSSVHISTSSPHLTHAANSVRGTFFAMQRVMFLYLISLFCICLPPSFRFEFLHPLLPPSFYLIKIFPGIDF